MDTFLKFELVEKPEWRKRNSEFEKVPGISEMLKDITIFYQKWKSKEKEYEDRKFELSQLKREMALEYFLKLQEGENFGAKDAKTFEKIFDDVKESEKLGKTAGKRRRDEYEHLNTKKHKKNSENSQNINNEYGSADSLPTSLELEEYLHDNSNKKEIEKDMKESRNLLRGYWHLRNELKKLPPRDRQKHKGIIDIETCIQSCHKILMEGLMDDCKTQPGKFSTLPRSAYFDNVIFLYPSFASEEIAFDAIDTLITQYHWMLGKISESKEEQEKVEMTFKCASLLLFGFLTLHPFADGNGRLARLLCSHYLSTFCPFETAIFNVFSPSSRDDYVRALVNGRQNLSLQ